MVRIEKTVFISYRRKDIAWALAVYQYLRGQKYDVFFDYTSIPSGDFEQIIVSNIKARAHFVVILTPTSLDRCSNPGDWFRREIETAIDEKRNIIPLFFDGFNFSSPFIVEKLTGKLANLNRYNGLEVPAGYFIEAMERLRSRYLNVPLSAVLHPIPTNIQKLVKEEQVAADKALKQRDDVKELIRPVEEKFRKEQEIRERKDEEVHTVKNISKKTYNRKTAIRLSIYILLLSIVCLIAGFYGKAFVDRLTNAPFVSPTNMSTHASTAASSPAKTITSLLPTETITPKPPTTTSPLALGVGSTLVSPKDGMVMVYVPAGNFQMGSNDGPPNRQPSHIVYLDSYWIDQNEVTNAMFTKFVKDTSYQTDAEGIGCSYIFDGSVWSCIVYASWKHPQGLNSNVLSNQDNPVVHISWNDAKAYCDWAGRRLPTEAEWEKAARGIDERIYPWGNGIPSASLLNFNNDVGNTTKVGNYPLGVSPYGVFDMAGNVLEWTADWYGDTYYESLYYEKSVVQNPSGPNSGQFRVHRGGSWYSVTDQVFSDARSWDDPSYSSTLLGFRCVRSQ